MPRSPLRPAALVAGFAALSLGLSACGSGQIDAPTSPDIPQTAVVASTDAWGAVARAVGGNYVQVESIIDSPNVDPHGYEATPQDAVTVGDAKLIVMNGGGYDAFMTGLISSSGNRAPVVDAVEASGLEGADEAGHAHEGEAGHSHEGEGEAGHSHEGEEGHDHEDGEAHDHGAFNEHVWYSLPTVQQVAQQLADRLAEIDPSAADYFRSNAQAVSGGVAQLTSKATDIGRNHPDARVVVTEPVPDYLLDAAGLENVTPQEFSSAVEEGTDPPAAVVARTLDLFRNQPPADVLIVNSQTESASTDQVRAAAETAGVPIVEMSETLPDGVDDYVQWMNTNLDELNAALSR
ncbi:MULTISPECIES: metal ABC transporter solute-binding protein, Zn/Mn family [Pseudonocardia]|uniref:Manganese ABC transporter substrate-binding lipoprotein n=2 Tax=Pseudonocardia TaxID=1847 RepID=A0A1Y2N9P7_PSEAH|nr:MULTISPECIES: zinc ABC transporter substrate-binding protein [Pseudonocardia]OSY43899.1 Manganese ABC transporter substrate-binding lipoprotein precursor [Pseudonocardia autotrophica]TDN74367.1 zinc/manganese transport system substrate-binding protein [Pseudonocardia autotrophica]BBG05132.1 metal ABC transporter substrate-binding protein [Pseudonocardia autotrophica]GEC27927.1 metal ABC transporter substrate-binding protein [Pseudonocardia saturnea]